MRKMSLLLVLALVVAVAALTACSGSHRVLPDAVGPATQVITFSSPIAPHMPAGIPTNVEQGIHAGIFLFDRGDFEGAAREFENARNRLDGPGGTLWTALSKAAAVSWVLAGREDLFCERVRDVQTCLNRFEVADLNARDKALVQLGRLAANHENSIGR